MLLLPLLLLLRACLQRPWSLQAPKSGRRQLLRRREPSINFLWIDKRD